MANDSITEQPQSAEPDAGIRQLDWLVGTWKVSGGVTGRITFEWLEGGFFLTQRVDLDHGGHRVRLACLLACEGSGDPLAAAPIGK
jgi:hypothetical protein